MQLPASPNHATSLRAARHSLVVTAFGSLAALALGCVGESRPGGGEAAKAFNGVSLTLRCPDRAFAAAVTPGANSWATRTGASVSVRVDPMSVGDDTDVGVIPAVELGAWAERGDLTPVPEGLRAADHPFQWMAVLPAYRERAIEWGGQARAVPLAGDGFLVVYRADRLADPKFADAFRKQFGRNPAAPSTWEEFADLAAALAAFDGKPSLPPMTGAEAAGLFFRAAACYDRPALNEAGTADLIKQLGPEATARLVSFQYAVGEDGPRLDAPAFAAAAQWLGRLAAGKCLPKPPATPADPAAAVGTGDAALAVLSLAQLANLPRENRAVPARFGLAPLPGTKWFTDPRTGAPVQTAVPNYVPYYAGGRLGVVRTRCPRPDAAFDLLVELGGPTRSLELVGTPGLGAGPFRSTHLERDRLPVWLGYGFDADRSRALQEAMRQYVRPEVKNAVFGLRGPDQAELNAAAADALGKVVGGELAPDAGLKQLAGEWRRIDEKTPKETRSRWRRFAAGVN